MTKDEHDAINSLTIKAEYIGDNYSFGQQGIRNLREELKIVLNLLKEQRKEIRKLKEDNKRKKEINEEHQKLNGELQKKLTYYEEICKGKTIQEMGMSDLYMEDELKKYRKEEKKDA